MTSAWTIGCIGCGNMGGAVLRGLAGVEGLTLLGHDHTEAKVTSIPGAQFCPTPRMLAERAQIILLGVKPHKVADVLAEIRPALGPGKVVVSMAAGVSMANLLAGVEKACPVVRIMPNTPALVGCGTFALCLDDPALPEATARGLEDLLQRLGRVMVLPEARFGAFTAFVGSGPGYVLYFMDAMAEAGLTLGFTRQQAVDMAAWLFEGSGRLARETATAPGTLREQVCSPAGVTVAGTNALDRAAVRGHIVEAVLTAFDREAEMRKA